uniref:Putative N-acetyltransferase ycf52-like protein n=2 Tax=Lygus hesperus TaxID=30085 RepID=A0A0A9VWN0_LYGHE
MNTFLRNSSRFPSYGPFHPMPQDIMSARDENSDSIELNNSEISSDVHLASSENTRHRDSSFQNPENPEQAAPSCSGFRANGQILSLQGVGLDLNWKKSRREESAMDDKAMKSKASKDSYLSEDSIAFSEWSNFSSQEMYSNSSEGLTCVMSELNIFRRSSSFSKRKIKEIKDFYKNKLLKNGVVIGMPVKTSTTDNLEEGFTLLMKSKIEVTPSESRLVDLDSLRSDSIVSPSISRSIDEQSVASHHSVRSNPGTSPPSQNSSGLLSQLSHLFSSLLGRNQPRHTQSCSLAVCESEYEPLRRCQKAMDVRKVIQN